jgi:hypothetical protein
MGISIQPTDPDKATLVARLEQSLTGEKEAVDARRPLVAKTLEEAEALDETFLNELIEVRRELVESRDGRVN